MSPVRLPVRLMIGGAALLGGAIAVPEAVWAQAQSRQPVPVVSQPVVQSVPGGEGMKLNDALNRLAKDPRDIAALLDAGKASLDLGDVDAAIGFFQRATTLSPGNPQAKAGLAGAYVLKRDPYAAIPLFTEAEKAGPIDPARIADRGLAYDLVGDNQTAQRYYRESLAAAPSDETLRRLALSLAISGDRRGMEATLSPLLQKQDKAAWRTRAFGLAILGYADEAEGIARQSLPADRATAISAYLRFMPRLTPSQQAAAGNLGHFPRAAEVGVDDPRVAQYARPRPALAAAAPVSAQPAAAEAKGKSKGKSKGRGGDKPAQAQAKAQQPAPVAPPEPKVSREVSGEPVQVAAISEPAKQPAAQTQLAQVTGPVTQQTAQTAATPEQAELKPVFSSPAATNPAPGFDLKQVPAVAAGPALTAPAASQPPVQQTPTKTQVEVVQAVPVTVAATQPAKPVSLEDAFADFGAPSAEAEPVAGAVDVRKLAPLPAPGKAAPAKDAKGKDVAAKDAAGKDAKGKPIAKADECAEPPAKGKAAAKGKTPTKTTGKNGAKAGSASATQCKDGKVVKAPSHPSRIWVQVATGKNKKALAFDWNRFAKEDPEVFKGRKGYTSAWGQTNRLLTGPFESEAAANAYIARLKKAGVSGAFVWTSPAGQVVDVLP